MPTSFPTPLTSEGVGLNNDLIYANDTITKPTSGESRYFIHGYMQYKGYNVLFVSNTAFCL